MLRLISQAVIALALLVGPAAAEGFTLPEIGLQNSGSCRQLAARDRTSNAMVALGCLDTTSHAWTLTPGSVQMNGASAAAVDLTLAGTPNPNMLMFKPGNAISFCPALSCVNGPPDGSVNPAFFDHQRASLLVSGSSQLDAQAEEQLIAVTMTIGTGYAPAWKANTAYALGANVVVGNAAYRAIAGGTSGSTAPPGTRPTGLPYTFTDGSVRWLWINDAAINAKLPGYFEAKAIPGAGQVWGLVSNLHLTADVIPTFAASSEVDFSNDSGTNCIAGQANCIGQYIRVTGANASTAGQAIELSGGGAIFGARITGNPTNAALSISTSGGTAGLGLGDFTAASFTTAAINDASTAPASLNISGTKSLAGIRVAATTPIGIDLSGGAYSSWQMLGKNWSVDTAGNISAASITSSASRLTGYTVATLPPCSATNKGTMTMATDVSAAPTYRQTGLTGGGSIAVPVFCNGTSYEAH